MSTDKQEFQPQWIDKTAPTNSYRSLFKWGAPDVFKHPNKRLFALMKKTFNMTDDDFQQQQKAGFDPVELDIKINLSSAQQSQIKKIVGDENAQTDSYSRIKTSYGKTMFDAMRLRDKIVENLPDMVVHPRNKDDVADIIQYCNKQKIPVYVAGGRSSVTRGTEAVKGGISLDMTTHMKRILDFNEINQTLKVEPGIYGPELEEILNNAIDRLQATRNYTCGHFPQSFEFSTVGGWIAALGSGQQSTYYGDMKDLVIAQEYITPAGEVISKEFAAAATGPAINDILLGNEGTFGVMVSATIKLYRYMPDNRKRYSYIFKNYQDALKAVREISQAEFGKPSVFRLSDPEETDVALKLYGVEGTLIDRWINIRGYKAMERCLLIGQVDGDASITGVIKKNIHKVCKKHGALYTTGYVVDQWEHGRYKDPYMREDLQDYGIMIDTLECTVNWDNLEKVHQGVREFIKARPDTICMTHSSHFYAQGTNLYFIFIAKMNEIKEYIDFQTGIINAIYEYGASLSHHHGVGKMLAPWFEKYIGANELKVLKALKKHFDPNNIMNPGSTLAFDGDKITGGKVAASSAKKASAKKTTNHKSVTKKPSAQRKTTKNK